MKEARETCLSRGAKKKFRISDSNHIFLFSRLIKLKCADIISNSAQSKPVGNPGTQSNGAKGRKRPSSARRAARVRTYLRRFFRSPDRQERGGQAMRSTACRTVIPAATIPADAIPVLSGSFNNRFFAPHFLQQQFFIRKSRRLTLSKSIDYNKELIKLLMCKFNLMELSSLSNIPFVVLPGRRNILEVA
jgi:hypothetical protein